MRPGGVFAITDQLALNILLERNMAPVAAAAGAGGDRQVIAAANGTLALMPLPVLLFTNGHVFFYQHLPRIHGVTVRPQPAPNRRPLYSIMHPVELKPPRRSGWNRCGAGVIWRRWNRPQWRHGPGLLALSFRQWGHS